MWMCGVYILVGSCCTGMYGADRLKFLLVGSGFTLPRSNDRRTVYVTVVVVAIMASTGTGRGGRFGGLRLPSRHEKNRSRDITSKTFLSNNTKQNNNDITDKE